MEQGNNVSFEFLLNNRPLSSRTESRYKIENALDESVLTIHQLEPEDSGNYSCVARSQFGTDTVSTLLTVKGLFIVIRI